MYLKQRARMQVGWRIAWNMSFRWDGWEGLSGEVIRGDGCNECSPGGTRPRLRYCRRERGKIETAAQVDQAILDGSRTQSATTLSKETLATISRAIPGSRLALTRGLPQDMGCNPKQSGHQ